MPERLRRTRVSLDVIECRMLEVNARLQAEAHAPLMREELLAGRLYTGPMYMKVRHRTPSMQSRAMPPPNASLSSLTLGAVNASWSSTTRCSVSSLEKTRTLRTRCSARSRRAAVVRRLCNSSARSSSLASGSRTATATAARVAVQAAARARCPLAQDLSGNGTITTRRLCMRSSAPRRAHTLAFGSHSLMHRRSLSRSQLMRDQTLQARPPMQSLQGAPRCEVARRVVWRQCDPFGPRRWRRALVYLDNHRQAHASHL